MRLKSAWKDWLRRRALRRAGITVEIHRATHAAGARSGVWVVDPQELDEHAVVYSFGTGDNIAWELAMIARFGCAVHAFDPTPRALAWLAKQAVPPQFRFTPVGLAAHDGEQQFAPPKKSRDINFRPCNAGADTISAPVRRLATLCRERGHGHVDVLKIDIEGGEIAALPDILATGPLPKQLLIEFHHGQHGIPWSSTASAIASLRAAGYRILHVSRRGLEFTFVRTITEHPGRSVRS